MWPGFIKEIRDFIAAAIANDASVNVTLVGGAVGGQTVAQGDPNGGGSDSWPVAGKGGEQLAQESGGNLAAALAALLLCTPPTKSTAVTKSDSTDLTSVATKGIWVGGAGDVAIKLTSDSAATTLLAVPAGTFIPGAFARVMSTGTTATSIVAFS